MNWLTTIWASFISLALTSTGVCFLMWLPLNTMLVEGSWEISRKPKVALENEVQRREMANEYLRVLGLHDCELDYGFLRELVGRHVATFAFRA